MKRKYDATAERNKVGIEQLRESHAKEEETFRTQLAVSEKETQNAKAMLFNNIRENKMSIERALYQQAKQHRLEIETQSNESALKFKAIAAQLDQLSKENKSLVQENAKRADAIVAKDKELAQAAKQVSDSGFHAIRSPCFSLTFS
jgi:3-polyprenyl-4-hydroxybenzoate decarboxylase